MVRGGHLNVDSDWREMGPSRGTEPIRSRVSEAEKPHQIREDVSHFDNSVSEIPLPLRVLGQGTRDSSSEPGTLLSLDCTRGCLTPHTLGMHTETVSEELFNSK